MNFFKKHYVSTLKVIWAILVFGTPFAFVLATPEGSKGVTPELAFRLGIIVSALSIGLQAYISLRELVTSRRNAS